VAGIEKEVRGAAQKAEGALNGGKKGSSGKKGKGCGADQAKRVVRELLK
jgi:hypothetical protein